MENTIQSAKDFLSKQDLSGKIEHEGVGQYSMTFDVDKLASILVAYHNSVRPEVVVPSEKIYNDYIDDFLECAVKNGFNECLSELRRLNPTLTFTELNHTAPTGDKSDEG